ncbi:MAG: ribosome-associated ATPase/putative transporter RbbA [Prochlorococcaceae cyanobacterium]
MTPAVRCRDLSLRYGERQALAGVSFELAEGELLGLIGPDGVGKSSLLALVAGARRLQQGELRVFGRDMARVRERRALCERIAYLPQGLGRHLHASLTVAENLHSFAALFGLPARERQRRGAALLASTGLAPFRHRPAGQLSGGMKQKLGLCCALVHDPDLLILDEPTTGVDPLSRLQFWQLIAAVRGSRPAMAVLVATATMEEAARFDRLLALDGGRVLAGGSPAELLERTGSASLEEAFIALLPAQRRRRHSPLGSWPPRRQDTEVVIEARGLSRRFGDFTAVDGVDLAIQRGEIFGFVGSNGCGKTTTMKMLTGLLPASGGEARLLGRPVRAEDLGIRRRVGYVSQAFSLYGELSVRRNLMLHARLFGLPAAGRAGRVRDLLQRFELEPLAECLPAALPVGQRQRLSLAVALIHRPEVLILDEPTSGVDPVARDAFWQALLQLSRNEGVTIVISTHFINEAARCDRLSLMHAGRVLESASPAELARRCGGSLEEAFLQRLQEASGSPAEPASVAALPAPAGLAGAENGIGGRSPAAVAGFSGRRLAATAARETLELRRDPLRALLALAGSVLLMVVMGLGISFDVENLPFAVLDRDGTSLSRDYADTLAGSRYFTAAAPLRDHADLDQRLAAGRLSAALEIPPDFGRAIKRGSPTQIGVWIDGAMPQRAETARAYLQGMHALWLDEQRQRRSPAPDGAVDGAVDGPAPGPVNGPVEVEVRFRYNPELRSLTAMVPTMMPLLLLLLPAMLTALSVVREKELGSVVNLYVTPLTRLEFLLGKQLPYIGLGVLNFLLLTLVATTVLGVPLRGSLAAATAAAGLYVSAATGFGLLVSAFMPSQISAIFGTAVLTILPALSFSGVFDPVSSLTGVSAWISRIYPTTHFLTIVQGTFLKGLGFAGLAGSFLPLLLAVPALLALSLLCLRPQEA